MGPRNEEETEEEEGEADDGTTAVIGADGTAQGSNYGTPVGGTPATSPVRRNSASPASVRFDPYATASGKDRAAGTAFGGRAARAQSRVPHGGVEVLDSPGESGEA